MKDLEHPLIELAGMKRQLADAEKQLSVKPMEGKFEGTIVLTPGCLGGFLSVSLETATTWFSISARFPAIITSFTASVTIPSSIKKLFFATAEISPCRYM